MVLAKGSAPNVKLDDKFYKLVDKMEVRPLVACSSSPPPPGCPIVPDCQCINITVFSHALHQMFLQAPGRLCSHFEGYQGGIKAPSWP